MARSQSDRLGELINKNVFVVETGRSLFIMRVIRSW